MQHFLDSVLANNSNGIKSDHSLVEDYNNDMHCGFSLIGIYPEWGADCDLGDLS